MEFLHWLIRPKSRRLDVTWQYSTKGTLWRLQPSAIGHIIIEDRDVVTKEVSFACLDRFTGTVAWENVIFAEKWWITIDTICQDVLFLHEYASPDMPEHRKIYALDVASGRLLWSNSELKLIAVHDESVYAAVDGLERRTFYELDLHTGVTRREVDDSDFRVLRDTIPGDRPAHIQFPSTLDDAMKDQRMRNALERAASPGAEICFAEHIEHEAGHIIGFYETRTASVADRKLSQRIAILGNEGLGPLFDDVVNEDVAMAVPVTFFAMESYVYYVKQKQTLRALNLSQQ